MLVTHTVGFGLRTNTGVDLNKADVELFTLKLQGLSAQVDGELLFVGTGEGIWEGGSEPAGCIVFLAEDVLQVSIDNEELRPFRTVGDIKRFIASKLAPASH